MQKINLLVLTITCLVVYVQSSDLRRGEEVLLKTRYGYLVKARIVAIKKEKCQLHLLGWRKRLIARKSNLLRIDKRGKVSVGKLAVVFVDGSRYGYWGSIRLVDGENYLVHYRKQRPSSQFRIVGRKNIYLPLRLSKSSDRIKSNALAVKQTVIPVRQRVPSKLIKIRVDQPTKTDRTKIPVTGGIPIPRGELSSVATMRVLDQYGQAIPCQTRCISVWPGGFVKVALVDFQANVPHDQETYYNLEYGTQVKQAQRVKGIKTISKSEDVIVDSGAIKFIVRKSGVGFIDEVYVKNKKIATGLNLAQFIGDKKPNKAIVKTIVVEEGTKKNSLRTVIKIEGEYRGHLITTPFVVRIHTYYDKTFVRVYHTFIYNGNRFKTKDHLTRLELGFHLATGIKTAIYGLENANPKKVNFSSFLYTRDDLNHTLSGENFRTIKLPKPAGWISVSDGKTFIQMGVRDFWKNYPKGLRAEGKKATCVLWPKEHAAFDLKTNHRFFCYKKHRKVISNWNDSSDNPGSNKVSQLHSGTGKGSAKTHELFFNFHSNSTVKQLIAVYNVFQEPSYLFVTPKWYADTKIFGFYNPHGIEYEDPHLKKWDQIMEISAKWMIFAQNYWRWYGMWDLGDFPYCGPQKHMENFPKPRFPNPHPPLEHGRWDYDKRFKENLLANCHYDLIEAMLLQYLRTGNRDYFRFAETSAMHVNEVDSCYIGTKKGLTSRHGCGHGQISLSHSFVRFRMPYYFLTGNERFKDAMRLAFEYVRDNRKEIFGNGVTIRGPSCATKILETWWAMSNDQEAVKHTRFILHYWVSRQQTKDTLGNYVGINKTWGRKTGGANEAFDPYNIMDKSKHEVIDPNKWDHPLHKQTLGWRFMNFGASEAMIDWYNLTSDQKVGKSVARFVKATILHGSRYKWFMPQRLLNLGWRLTDDPFYKEQLTKYMKFPKWGKANHFMVWFNVKDNMAWDDYQYEFSKLYTKNAFVSMGFEAAAQRLLLQPYSLYTFEPYDKKGPFY